MQRIFSSIGKISPPSLVWWVRKLQPHQTRERTVGYRN